MNEEIKLIFECLRELLVQSESWKLGELAGKIDYLLNPKQEQPVNEQTKDALFVEEKK